MTVNMILSFVRHPIGLVTTVVVVIAVAAVAWMAVDMFLNQPEPLSDTGEGIASSPSVDEALSSPSNPPATIPVPPPSGCYWRRHDGKPYALAYPPHDTLDRLDGKPLVGYAVVWQFAQDEIIVKRHEEQYRLSQWPIAYYLADDSANRVLLDMQALYEAEGERIAGETVKETCSIGSDR